MRHSNTERESLLNKLLRHDLEQVAHSLNLVSRPSPISDADAAALLNFAEHLSRQDDADSKNTCLMICGLIWEHRHPNWLAAPSFIIHLLSRLGLGPSMSMVDADFDRDTQQLRPLGNLALETAVVARCIEHEVTVGTSTTLLLSEFQHEVWRAIDQYRRVGISAPTSAGKSHVLVFKTLQILLDTPGSAVFVVPTLSLIQQVTRDLRSAAAQIGFDDLAVLQTFTDKAPPRSTNVIYVLTQERALMALSKPSSLKSLRVLIVDEVQNIERVAENDDDRSRTLYEVIQEFELSRSAEKIIISGPRVENIAQLCAHFFGEGAKTISASLPPVVNITYAFSKRGRAIHLTQYTTLPNTPHTLKLDNNTRVGASIIGKSRYTDSVISEMSDILVPLSHESGTIVFSPTSDQATKTAIKLAEQMSLPKSTHIDTLIEYVHETVHPNYALAESLTSGIGYHHGKMPQHLRVSVEQAFSDSDIKIIACTTTLMQGVNLPAKNLIARNPHLYVQKKANGASISLTPYEFANLRGRAGRLLKDFVGRSIILDENSFEQNGIDFDFPSKTVSAGYGDRFHRNRDDIVDDLFELREPSEAYSGGNSDLVTYIRQNIVRFGQAGLSRLQRVGIYLSDDEFSYTTRMLKDISVPREVCAASPYWDPIQLERIYAAHKRGDFPTLPLSASVSDFVDRLLSILLALASIAPYYFEKYVGIYDDNKLRSILISAHKWSTGRPLREIISWRDSDETTSWEIIDREIAQVNKKVVYDIPKLLKPLAAMQNPENPLLGFMELGANRPKTRRLIELGLPRETAIRLAASIGALSAPDGAVDDRELIAKAVDRSASMNYWERRQVNELFRPRSSRQRSVNSR